MWKVFSDVNLSLSAPVASFIELEAAARSAITEINEAEQSSSTSLSINSVKPSLDINLGLGASHLAGSMLVTSGASYSSSSVIPSTSEASSWVGLSHGNHDEGPPCKHRRKTETETLVALSKNKNKIKGGSFAELFTLQQLEEHICGLRKWDDEVCKSQVNIYRGLCLLVSKIYVKHPNCMFGC
jgi:hypothetical protein